MNTDTQKPRLEMHSVKEVIERLEKASIRSYEAIGSAKTEREIGKFMGRVEAFTEALMEMRHNVSIAVTRSDTEHFDGGRCG